LTFQKFLGLTLSDRVQDANTIWLFREDCGKSGCVERGINQAIRFSRKAKRHMSNGFNLPGTIKGILKTGF
jgi:hypothetical protein